MDCRQNLRLLGHLPGENVHITTVKMTIWYCHYIVQKVITLYSEGNNMIGFTKNDTSERVQKVCIYLWLLVNLACTGCGCKCTILFYSWSKKVQKGRPVMLCWNVKLQACVEEAELFHVKLSLCCFLRLEITLNMGPILAYCFESTDCVEAYSISKPQTQSLFSWSTEYFCKFESYSDISAHVYYLKM